MANTIAMSISLLLLVGVSTPRHIAYYDAASSSQPIITASQGRRICAELCMSGLGGEPCGTECSDVIPQGLPTASAQSDSGVQQVDYTRKDACPVLCANQLGYPLCNCTYGTNTTPFFKVDFLQICSHFCIAYNYQIYGCNSCAEYKNMTGYVGSATRAAPKTYDWNSWCLKMCQEGDGGSACYCDLLPLGLRID